MRKTNLIKPQFILENVISKDDLFFAEKNHFFAVRFVHPSCTKHAHIGEDAFITFVKSSPKTLRKILLINEKDPSKLISAIETYRPQFLQLESEIQFGDLKSILLEFPKLQFIQTIYATDEFAVADAMEMQHFSNMSMIVNEASGTQIKSLKATEFWNKALEIIKFTKIPLIIHDNISSETIISAIESSRPFAICFGQSLRKNALCDQLKFEKIMSKIEDYFESKQKN